APYSEVPRVPLPPPLPVTRTLLPSGMAATFAWVEIRSPGPFPPRATVATLCQLPPLSARRYSVLVSVLQVAGVQGLVRASTWPSIVASERIEVPGNVTGD